MTNFDKIKSYDVDKLAELLSDTANSYCIIFYTDTFLRPTKENFKKWLLKEVRKK